MSKKMEVDSESTDFQSEAEILQLVIGYMQKLTDDGRERLLRTLATFFEIGIQQTVRTSLRQVDGITSAEPQISPSFSEDRSMSPKEFLLEKQPRTDVERVACLAFYLTNYRNTQHFKTIDISKLNTEAAQRKFSNAAKAVDNATRNELLVPSVKGQKQLGAVGEVFVQALPDRTAAKDAASKIRMKKRRPARKTAKKKTA